MTDEKGHQMADHEDSNMEPSDEMPIPAAVMRAEVNAQDILLIVNTNAKRDKRARTFVMLIAVITAFVVVIEVWFSLQSTNKITDLVQTNKEQVEEHRTLNQGNHDCIIGLILDVVDGANADGPITVDRTCPEIVLRPSADGDGE